MEKSFSISIAIFIIYGFSVSGGEKFTCRRFDENCNEDGECCSKKCYHKYNYFKWIKGRCTKPDDFPVMPKIQNGMCSYYEKSQQNDFDLFLAFGENGAHNWYPPGTRFILTYNKDSVEVMINDEIPKLNGTILDVSREVAEALGVEDEGLFPCQMREREFHYARHFLMVIGPQLAVLIFFELIRKCG